MFVIAEDSPFFRGLGESKLLGSRCTACGYVYATPRSHCMECGAPTAWREMPLTGRIHTFTTCHYGGEAFLKETPFTLVLVEFDGADTLFLSRLKGIKHEDVRIGLTNMGSTPLRASAVEEALKGQPLNAETIAKAAEQAAEGTDPPADLNASSEYKSHLARVLCRRALEEAA